MQTTDALGRCGMIMAYFFLGHALPSQSLMHGILKEWLAEGRWTGSSELAQEPCHLKCICQQ